MSFDYVYYNERQKQKNSRWCWGTKHQLITNLRAFNLKMTLFFLGSLPFLLYRTDSFLEKSFFHLFSVYMILTDNNISQSKVAKPPSKFVFKLTNIGLLIEKYFFCNNNQTFKNNTTEYAKTNKYFHQII